MKLAKVKRNPGPKPTGRLPTILSMKGTAADLEWMKGLAAATPGKPDLSALVRSLLAGHARSIGFRRAPYDADEPPPPR